MEQFHHAVRYWSRRRELAADAAGAGVTSADAASRALLRTAAIHPRIAEMLQAAADAPDGAPPDLVASVLEGVAARGLDDPAAHLEEGQPYPTDTHPPTRQRIAALDQPLSPELLAAAAAAPPPEALSRLDAYFAEPAAFCRAATADFSRVVRRNMADFHERLEAAVAEVGAEELLRPEATFPERLKGARRVKVDPKQRVVTVTAVLPRGMKSQQFADLISRYRAAAEARRLLAAEQATTEASPVTAAPRSWRSRRGWILQR